MFHSAAKPECIHSSYVPGDLKGLHQLHYEYIDVISLISVSMDQKNQQTEGMIHIIMYYEILRLNGEESWFKQVFL